MRPCRKTTGLGRNARVSIVLLCALLVAGPAFAQNWKWSTETVDKNGLSTSIAVDKNGDLHLSYLAAGVKYAFRPVNSDHWFTMDIGSAGGFAQLPTKLALDSQGDPSICFTPSSMKLASFDGHKWNTQEIDPGSGTIMFTCSLAVASDGTPHVIWYHYGNPDGGFYLHLKYAVLEKGAWMARTVDFEGQTGKWNSMVLDSQGNPHVTYDAFNKGEMKYAYWNGKDWVSSVVDSPDISPADTFSHGMGNSLVLTRDGKAQISYETEDSLKYAWQKGDSWKLDTVDKVALTGGWVGFRTRQALDPQGHPHIVYEDGGAVKHAYWDGSKWQIQVISGPGINRDRYEDIAIDQEGNIYISYRDASDGSLKVATGRAQQATTQSASKEAPPQK
jgi:hypothetical protein